MPGSQKRNSQEFSDRLPLGQYAKVKGVKTKVPVALVDLKTQSTASICLKLAHPFEKWNTGGKFVGAVKFCRSSDRTGLPMASLALEWPPTVRA